MVRHTHRPYPYGGGRGRGESYGGNGTGNAGHLLLCHHCNTSHPRHRFPKRVLTKYDKRLARGDTPSSIKMICFDCCERSPGSIAATVSGSSSSSTASPFSGSGNIKPLAPTRHTTAAHGPGPSPAAERRGCCTVCRVEYPLTVTYFPRGNTRVQAMESRRRVCFPCRTRQHLEQAIDDNTPDNFVERAESEEEAIYVSESDDNSEEEAPITRIEDTSVEKQLEAARARKEYSRVSTDVRAALAEARKLRLHHRFVPFSETLKQEKLKQAREQLDALAMMSWTEVRARNAHWGVRRPAVETFFEAQVEINLGIINEFDLAMQPFPQAVEFADPFLPRGSQHYAEDDDQDAEEDDIVEFRHLTEREKHDRLELLREQQHAQEARPPRNLDKQEVEQVIDDDLINRFEMNIAIANDVAAKNEASVDSFEMICLLRALNEHAEKPRKASSLGANMPKPLKKLRFADDV
ncbi:verprolin [Pseudozyma hubeiensis SY62]|uniref:Verprolin n=1 Tax=Pseudozyma hubeiensis (strain SY62) TaxID=1305764 RepID=R9NWZ4_PSEHS|nr:verprolin [Pseudozyma hubeiensis SY62]GAC93027.1 verprolin [Pseudozyma hubeiensis SY62]